MHIFRSLKHTYILFLLPLGSLTAQNAIDSELETIHYAQALQRAVASDPRLDFYTSLVESAEGRIEQAGLRPNPVIGAEMENFLGSGPYRDIQGIEVTLGVRQLIETADKREKRTTLEETKKSLIDWERESYLAQVEASVRSTFIKVLLAQELRELRQGQLALAERSADETAELVEAARASEVEQTRAGLAVRRQRLALEQAERELLSAKSELASLWGETARTAFNVVGEIVLQSEAPDFAVLASQLSSTAALARYSAEGRTREAALDLEQARSKPDFEIFAGGRYFNEAEGDAGFVLGVEMPWPLFDKNQGNIRTARARLNAVSYERESTRRELLIFLNRAYQQMLSAQAEADAIQSDLLPAAEATLRDTETGYQRGRFSQLSVLESRRTLFEVREAYLEALKRYAVAETEIQALTRPTKL